MIECPRCGSWEFLDVSGLDERPMTSLICAECGMAWTHVRFRKHRYSPPDRLIITPPVAFLRNPEMQTMDFDVTLIYCGPPAPCPSVPTPEDILFAASGLLL